MKKRIGKQVLCLLLTLSLVMGFMPVTAFAGYDDGDTCEYCGGYRFDDWLCDCGPHCSEFADDVDCYLAHHCANCLQACDEDEKCDECEFCSECWGETDQHCVLCGQHDDDVCDNCFTCSSCQLSEGTHCDDCGGCMENLEKCKDHEPELGQENHCGDCANYCNSCGDCFRGEYEELWCDDCNMCFDCAETEGYHCNLQYCCVPGERCEECEYCNECGVSEGLHCPECEKHVDEWCERGGEGTHCMDCSASFTCEQCGECTDCAEVEFCEECGVCEDCCRDNAASEGCSCGEYCVLSGDWNEHFCPECETCFDENEQCEICGYCIECCAAESECSDNLCIEDADYADHFCEQCQKCFHDVEACDSCQDAGVILCTECCSAVTEETGCGHDYCVNDWQWEEHFCPICRKCYDDCDHEPEAHTHIYNSDGNCKVCGMNKDGKPIIYRQPKSVVITPDKIDDTYATFTVEVFGDDLQYQWYYFDSNEGTYVTMKDGIAFKNVTKKTLWVYIAPEICKEDNPRQIICEIRNSKGHAITEVVEFSVTHKISSYTTDSTHHWYVCENCGKAEGKKEHRFGGWEVVRKATTREHGLKERICYDCAYVEEGLIPRLTSKHEHDYSAAYIQGSDYHWGQCSCGIENKGSMEKHDYGEWVTITKPTVATPGKQMRTCNTCGYEDTQTIGPQGHTHEFYNEEYKKNHRDNGNYGSLVYDDRLVPLYHEPYGKSDKNYHYAYCVVEGCDAYERYSHIWHTEWYDAPTSASDGYYERYCVDCFYHTESKTTVAGKYRIETINGYTNVQTAKPGSKVKITPYNIYPVGQYFDPDYSAVSVNYTWGAGASGTWASVDVEHHKPDSEDTREYWYFIMPDIPKDKASGDVETDYWNFYVEVELEIYDCCNDEETADDRFYEWVGKVDANCGQTGYTGDYKCTLCNYVKIRGEVTPITGEAHGELIQEDSVEGTCTKAGYTGGKICSVCKQLVEPRVYTGRQHNPQRVPGSYIPSTCITNGQSVQIACADCGVVLKASKPLAKASHDWQVVEGTVTCINSGTIDHLKCKTCGVYSIDDGATIIRNSAKLYTSALGHDYEWVIDQPATTSADGRKHQYCNRCKVETPAVVICKIGTINLSKTSYTYDGVSKFPDVIVRNSSKELIQSDHYTIKKPIRSTNVGTYSYTVTFNGEYSGSVDLYYKIDQASIDKKTATLSYTSTTYNGSAKKPTVTIDGLIKDTDYTVTYENNINTGSATVTVTGKGNYTGTITKKFTINKAEMTDIKVTGKTATYNGKPHTITLTGAPEGAEILYKTSIIKAYDYPKPARTDAGTTTVYYKVTHPNYNAVEGKVDIVVNKATMSDVKVSGVNKTYDGNSYSITIKDTPANSKIYYKTSSDGIYLPNKPTRTDAGTTTVYYKVTNPNYNDLTGTAKIVINKANLSGISAIGKTVTYNGKAHTITMKGVPSGAKVYYKTSSSGSYSVTKPTRTDAGTTTVYYKVTKANYNDVTGSAKIVVNKCNLSKAVLEKTTYVYTGKANKPKATVTNSSGTILKKDTHYIVSYKNNTKVGKATVTIKGKGNYKGALTKTFKINPKPTKITSLTKGKKSFTVKWSKKITQTSGYQIYYTTSKTRTNGKQITISKNTTIKKTISKLKSGKKYYVWVRTYKTVNGTKYYSTWSDRKYVTTK